MNVPSTPASPERDASTTMNVSAPVPRSTSAGSVGAMVSRYVLLEEIGRGGMGRVLRAYDPKLQREVALKEVRGRLHAEATPRLVAEARAMAKLSHKNVVAVYDVEALSSGEVVLVMEYVAGQTLKTWVQDQERPWREVVEHFAGAGRGLVAAHAAGLLHRDFKPANVLVADKVKVTDFGLAKAGAAASSEADACREGAARDLTATGTVMGTPRYMAPEQHLGETLTAATDQYAFCVALWEALCGTPPFSGGDLLERKRRGPPAWPDPTVPRRVVAAIERGLAPRPGDRWPDMQTLLRALSHDPARRRARWAAALSIAATVATVATISAMLASARARRCSGADDKIASVWSAAQRERVEAAILGVRSPWADAVWERTGAALDGYARDWVAMHVEACEATTVRGEASEAVMDLRMACLERARTDLVAAVSVLADADAQTVRKAHAVVAELHPLRTCGDVEGLQADVQPPEPDEAEAVAAARTQLSRAEAERRAGDFEGAAAAAATANEIIEELGYGPIHAEVALAQGRILDDLGQYDAGIDALRRALRIAAAWRRVETMRVASIDLITSIGYRQRRTEVGLSHARLARGLAREPEHEAKVRTNVALVLEMQGNYPDAEAEALRAVELAEEAPGPTQSTLVAALNALAAAKSAQGAYEDAASAYQRAVVLRERTLGAEHPVTSQLRNNLALVLYRQGNFAAAEVELRQTLAALEPAFGSEHPDVASTRYNLAAVVYQRGQYAEAEAEFRRVLALREHQLGPEHPDVAGATANVAASVYAQRRYTEAEALHRRALAIRERSLGPEHPDIAESHHNLGEVLRALGRADEAEIELRRAATLWEASLGPDHPQVARARAHLAEAVLARDAAPVGAP